MKIRFSILVLMCAILSLDVAYAQLPAKVFGALPEIADAAVSPDGKTVALLENIGGVTAVRFFDLEGGGQTTGLRIGKIKARGLQWANNEQILLLVSNTSTLETVNGMETFEFWRYAAIHKDTNKVTYLLSKGSTTVYTNAGALLHLLPDEPNHVLIGKMDPNFQSQRNANSRIGNAASGASQDTATYNIFKVSLKNGVGRKFKTGNTDTVDWVVGDDGQSLLRIDRDDRTNVKTIFLTEGKNKMVKMHSFDTDDSPDMSFYALGHNNNTAIITSYARHDKYGAYRYDLSSGKISDPIFANDKYDLSSLKIKNGRLEAFSYVADKPETIYLNDENKKMVDALVKPLGGAHVNIISQSTDRKVSVIHATYVDRPASYYLFESDTRSLSSLGPTYPSLNETNSGRRTKYNYETPDGLMVHGYLTIPANIQDPKSMPLVVLPHGGPEARDNQQFDWWAAAYAAQGYLVYQPNFRGSDGYGNRFRKAGWGEWGRKMQDDISNGVRKLIADGIADADQICIVGASYGGYAALAGASLTPDLYKCAISVNGVSDLLRMLGAEAVSSEFSLDFWERRIGSRFRDQAEIEAVSPSRQAQNVRAPILLIHGRDDTVVPYWQSELMEDALKKSGKSVKFVTLDGEDHWLSGSETRTKMLEESVKFLNKYLSK